MMKKQGWLKKGQPCFDLAFLGANAVRLSSGYLNVTLG